MNARKLALAVFVGVTVMVALAWTAPGWDVRASLSGSAVYFWLVVCLGAECLWLRTPGGHATLSMASSAHFAALLVLTRSEAMAVAAAASLLVELIVLRKPWARVLFNASQAACAVGLSRTCFDALAGPAAQVNGVLAPSHYLPLLAAATVYYVANHGATSIAVALDQGLSPWKIWRANFGIRYEAFSSATLFSLGALFAVQYQVAGALGVIPFILPVVLAKDAYDRFLASLRRVGDDAGRPRPLQPDHGKSPAEAA
jgi:hypothetical protein